MSASTSAATGRSPNDPDFAIPDMDEYMAGVDGEERNRIHGELIKFLTQSTQMRKTAKSSLKQSLYAGGGAFAGSFLGGPVGGLVGGVVGSVIGFLQGDEYDGVILAVLKLEEARKQVLLKEVATILVTAGAQLRQLESADGLREQLNRFVDQEVVRDGVWTACMNSIKT